MNSVDIARVISAFVDGRDVVRHGDIVAHLKSLGAKRTQRITAETMTALGFERLARPHAGLLYRRPSRPISEWPAVLESLAQGREAISFDDVERALIEARYVVARRTSSAERAAVREMMAALGFARREVVGPAFRRVLYARQPSASRKAA